MSPYSNSYPDMVATSNRWWLATAGPIVALVLLVHPVSIRGQQPEDQPSPQDRALAQATSCDFEQVLLADALELLAARHKMQITIDGAALKQNGLDPDLKVTLEVTDVPLRAALDLLLGSEDLAAISQQGGLIVTTREVARRTVGRRMYDVARHVDASDRAALVSAIRTVVEPASWDRVGGAGSISMLGSKLSVRQTDAVQHQLQGLLTELLSVGQTRLAVARPYPARLQAALDMPISVDFKNVTLSAAAAFLESQLGVDVHIDRVALDEAKISADARVSLAAKQVPLPDLLDLLTAGQAFAWTVSHDVILITSAQRAERVMHLRVYPLDALLDGNTTGPAVARAVSSTVAPQSWDRVGGPGSLQLVGDLLIVRQTAHTQRAIRELLAEIVAARQ